MATHSMLTRFLSRGFFFFLFFLFFSENVETWITLHALTDAHHRLELNNNPNTLPKEKNYQSTNDVPRYASPTLTQREDRKPLGLITNIFNEKTSHKFERPDSVKKMRHLDEYFFADSQEILPLSGSLRPIGLHKGFTETHPTWSHVKPHHSATVIAANQVSCVKSFVLWNLKTCKCLFNSL